MTADEPVIRTDLTPEQIAKLDEEANVWAAFTSIQADAVRATATLHLRDPLELALEFFPLLHEPASQASASTDSTVNDALTGACDLSTAPTETFAVSFSTAPPN